ncbi:hypothetical protein F0310_05335 (plasmid) [Borrelia sp. A-FGy1]|uniref:hypothetical protein n=1 Tax=Borrelia sp. A-FGy1 TaxID=2608247 RepID=UPI0015F400C8|nr:hypothetical protein [Borrelia sp. A-FGy1]QMU99838.1 hypothetical protein F0310_05335 [Borrelia sp. A-FGy1]
MKNKVYKGKYLKYYKSFSEGEISVSDIARIEGVSYSSASKAMNKCLNSYRQTQKTILNNIKSSYNTTGGRILNSNSIDHVLCSGNEDESIEYLSKITSIAALKKLASVDTLKVEVTKLISNLFFNEKYAEVVIKEQVYNALRSDLARIEHALRNAAYHSTEERNRLIAESLQLKEEIKRHKLTFKEKIFLKRLKIEKEYYTATLNDKEFKQIVKTYLYNDNL